MQAFPPRTPLHDFFAHLRRHAESETTLVRLLTEVTDERGQEPDDNQPFVSVLVRTQGRRRGNLVEALTSLAAQTSDDFEVLLLVHSDDEAPLEAVNEMVQLFDAGFAERVSVMQVRGGGRARPLNVGLEAAKGRYIAFLDDDDLAKQNWVEAFERGAEEAPGSLIRSITVDMTIRKPTRDNGAPYITLGGVEATHSAPFDLPEHLYTNRTPLCSIAVPRALVETTAMTFDDELPVLEDWHFLLRAAMLVGVYDTEEVTSVYHRWVGGESALSTVSEDVWMATRRTIQDQLDSAPLLLPPGSASRLASLPENIHQLEAELDQTRRAVDDALHERDALWLQKEEQRLALERLVPVEASYVRMSNSLSWRITRPLRAVRAFFRS